MSYRLAKLRWRRRLHRSQKQVEEISAQAEADIEKHVFDKFSLLRPLRRFILAWVGLIVIAITLVAIQNFALSGYYQKKQGIPGGIYSEGITGTITNVNPIFASTDADNSVSKLIFAPLFNIDSSGNLEGVLAQSIKVDSTGRVYTVTLKPNLTWQDGKPLTANDVVFTINTIENPNVQSPLINDWQGISVKAINSRTVSMSLPNILASFPENLTLGILPAHILQSINPSDLRSANFNTIDPIGAGPFKMERLNVVNGNNRSEEVVQIGLAPNPSYVNGEPKVSEMIEDVYADPNQMVSDFNNKQLSAMLPINAPPANITDKSSVVVDSPILQAEKMVFFKNSTGVLSDQSVRQALVESANVDQIIKNLQYNTRRVDEPLLKGQLGYNKIYAQAGYDPKTAASILTSDGWIPGRNGYRYKNNQVLSFTLTVEDNSEDVQDAKQLVSYWKAIGVECNLQQLQPADYQNALSYHEYDAILSTIGIGSDPDVFVYWDSSQADIRSANRLNLSEFKDSTSDIALESGRTRLNPVERAIKYQPFLADWQSQYPALGLYQPRLLYISNGPIYNFPNYSLNNALDRFDNVQDWEIRQAYVTS